MPPTLLARADEVIELRHRLLRCVGRCWHFLSDLRGPLNGSCRGKADIMRALENRRADPKRILALAPKDNISDAEFGVLSYRRKSLRLSAIKSGHSVMSSFPLYP